jgi:CheY-like chemotaxis protein
MASTAQRILVVEDDDDVRESIAAAIAAAGYEVDTARHGREALEYLDRADQPPAAVLLDLMMPVMDGWTFLSHLGDRRRAIPVVVLSAARDALLPPQVELLRKPFAKEQLLGALARRARIGPVPPRVDLVAYVGDACPDSERAIEILAAVLGQFEPEDVTLRVRKVENTSQAELDRDGVLLTPTLVIRRPLPLRIAGPLQSTRFLTTLFDIAEVPRRRGR